MWIYIVLTGSISISVILGIYVFSGIKKTYDQKGTYSDKLLSLWFTMWAFHHIPLILSSLYGVWLIQIDKTFALAGGSVLFVTGAIILPMGMIEFRSLKRSTGQDISKLITTGIYRWSRNPQFVGWFLMLLGISLAGRSGLAFLLTGVFAIVIYLYTILLAEPYLESLYGEEYRLFKKRTARWIGIPGKNNEITSG
ncbi:MAG: isoprenylcysteine carboxylmethyltransferase family protein [Chlorobi bacterium]|nr:isoprenylcysteine carboxylmethyltransferase family protein [Chlorobiota bacterium]